MLFVSYATHDLERVRGLVSAIETRGIPCWYAARDIRPSEIFAKAIADAVRASSGCVVVVSKASLASDGVLRELELTSSAGKPFFPILIEPCSLSAGFDYYLSLAQWIDLSAEGEAGLDRLVAREAAAPPPGPVYPRGKRLFTPLRLGLGLASVGIAALLAAASLRQPADPVAAMTPAEMRLEALDAIRRLDVDRMRRLIRAGWLANSQIDAAGSNALHFLAETCEWNPDADPQKMVQFGRMLLDNGTSLIQVNVYDDTPLDIARAERFCGPDHALTKFYTTMCTGKTGLSKACT
ncbi:MAG TPA: toll/interleukin-1 receptor domain-containing protein [Novosphingobium sp.]|nr:toll/interleukin-1 receptor domain-containing protein [Novosphingobium sp.]